MSVQDTVSSLHVAKQEVEAAISLVNEALDKLPGAMEAIERARGAVAEAQGNANSHTLEEYLGILDQADEAVKSSHAGLTPVPGQLAHAKEQGDTYIGVATS